jgi:hypothetical protein
MILIQGLGLLLSKSENNFIAGGIRAPKVAT